MADIGIEKKIHCGLYVVSICKRNLHKYLRTENMKSSTRREQINTYYKCACKSTKLDGKCIFDKKCKTEAISYNVQQIPTGHTYIGKSQRHFSKRINQHIDKLVAFWIF